MENINIFWPIILFIVLSVVIIVLIHLFSEWAFRLGQKKERNISKRLNSN